MNIASDALAGGFAQPVFNAQSVFRMVMDAMARPGTIKTVASDAAPPAPFGLAAGSIALALCDHETPVWLSSALSHSAVPSWLRFHAGAPVTSEKAEAAFAFFDAADALSSFSMFSLGTQEYPDRSTTLVIEVEALEGGQGLTLTGPGIRVEEHIAPRGLPNNFLQLRADNRALFPRGADLVLTAGDRFLCLPRTTKIKATEG